MNTCRNLSLPFDIWTFTQNQVHTKSGGFKKKIKCVRPNIFTFYLSNRINVWQDEDLCKISRHHTEPSATSDDHHRSSSPHVRDSCYTEMVTDWLTQQMQTGWLMIKVWRHLDTDTRSGLAVQMIDESSLCDYTGERLMTGLIKRKYLKTTLWWIFKIL